MYVCMQLELMYSLSFTCKCRMTFLVNFGIMHILIYLYTHAPLLSVVPKYLHMIIIIYVES